jgi:hypothetical protein
MNAPAKAQEGEGKKERKGKGKWPFGERQSRKADRSWTIYNTTIYT